MKVRLMPILITKSTNAITQGFTAPATTLGMVMEPPLSRHTVTRILCNCVKEIGR
jgi:hypothetical protein